MQANYKLIIDDTEIENVGNLSWGDDIETIACDFSFDTTDNLSVGSKVLIANADTGKEVLRGILTDKSRNNLNKFSQKLQDIS